MKKACKWHKGDEPLKKDETPGYPNCSNMLETKICDGCGKEFLDWQADGFDDVMAAPRVDSRGDLCCAYCLPHIEADIEEAARMEMDTYFESGYDRVDSYNLPKENDD